MRYAWDVNKVKNYQKITSFIYTKNNKIINKEWNPITLTIVNILYKIGINKITQNNVCKVYSRHLSISIHQNKGGLIHTGVKNIYETTVCFDDFKRHIGLSIDCEELLSDSKFCKKLESELNLNNKDNSNKIYEFLIHNYEPQYELSLD